MKIVFAVVTIAHLKIYLSSTEVIKEFYSKITYEELILTVTRFWSIRLST